MRRATHAPSLGKLPASSSPGSHTPAATTGCPGSISAMPGVGIQAATSSRVTPAWRRSPPAAMIMMVMMVSIVRATPTPAPIWAVPRRIIPVRAVIPRIIIPWIEPRVIHAQSPAPCIERHCGTPRAYVCRSGCADDYVHVGSSIYIQVNSIRIFRLSYHIGIVETPYALGVLKRIAATGESRIHTHRVADGILRKQVATADVAVILVHVAQVHHIVFPALRHLVGSVIVGNHIVVMHCRRHRRLGFLNSCSRLLLLLRAVVINIVVVLRSHRGRQQAR